MAIRMKQNPPFKLSSGVSSGKFVFSTNVLAYRTLSGLSEKLGLVAFMYGGDNVSIRYSLYEASHNSDGLAMLLCWTFGRATYVGYLLSDLSRFGLEPAMSNSPVGSNVAVLWYILAISDFGISIFLKKRSPFGAEGR